MRAQIGFVATLWLALIGVWLVSGEQFLDLMFAMPDAGPADDAILNAVVRLEEWRGELGLPDLLAALRAALHRTFGLG